MLNPIDMNEVKRANPHLDQDKLEEMLADLREMPRIAKRGYRLAPVGSDRVFTEMPWKNGEGVRCYHQDCRRQAT